MLNAAAEPDNLRVERHASWAELFFDLVAVAGVGALAHVLEAELDASSLGLYALLFLAFWLCWTTFMLYGNVAAGRTRVIRLLVGMFGLGVMAASVPGVAHTVLEEGHSDRPLTVFTIAYIATRVYGAVLAAGRDPDRLPGGPVLDRLVPGSPRSGWTSRGS